MQLDIFILLTFWSHDEENSSLNKMSEQSLNQLFSTLDFDLESIKCILNERKNLLSNRSSTDAF